jgi:hypothetical protein
MRIRGHGRLQHQPLLLVAHCAAITHSRRREILDSLLRLSPPTVAPGQIPGALRFVSLALHILPHKGERRRRNVSARNVSEPYLLSETCFSKARPLLSAHTPTKSCGTQQAWMNSRNLFNITIAPASVNLDCMHAQVHAENTRPDTPNRSHREGVLRDFGGLPWRPSLFRFCLLDSSTHFTQIEGTSGSKLASHVSGVREESSSLRSGFRLAGSDAAKTPQLADSASTLYTTSFPNLYKFSKSFRIT